MTTNLKKNSTPEKVEAWMNQMKAEVMKAQDEAMVRNQDSPLNYDEVEFLRDLVAMHGLALMQRNELEYAIENGDKLPTEITAKGTQFVTILSNKLKNQAEELYG